MHQPTWDASCKFESSESSRQSRHEEARRNETIVFSASAVHSYDHQDLTTIEDVSKTLLDQVEAFFVSYNQQRGKKFNITGTGGPKKAIKFLKAGIVNFQQRNGQEEIQEVKERGME